MPKSKIFCQYLKLKMNGQSILLPLAQVKTVLRLPALHEVPNEAKGFSGVLNYHGVSVPVYNLGSYIGTELVQLSVDTPLVLCELEKGLVGLLVSDVEEVMSLEADELQKLALSQLPAYVQGTYESEAESMWVIALDALIDPKAYLTRVVDE